MSSLCPEGSVKAFNAKTIRFTKYPTLFKALIADLYETFLSSLTMMLGVLDLSTGVIPAKTKTILKYLTIFLVYWSFYMLDINKKQKRICKKANSIIVMITQADIIKIIQLVANVPPFIG